MKMKKTMTDKELLKTTTEMLEWLESEVLGYFDYSPTAQKIMNTYRSKFQAPPPPAPPRTSKPFFLDVRTTVEYNGNGLSSALNIPYGEVQENLDKIPKDREILVYCRSGGRAQIAVAVLLMAGFDARNIETVEKALKKESSLNVVICDACGRRPPVYKLVDEPSSEGVYVCSGSFEDTCKIVTTARTGNKIERLERE